MQKIILAYATSKGLDQMTREDAQRLTRVNLAFGSIRDGLLNLEGLPHLRAQLNRLRSFHPQLKFVLSIGGLGADGFSQLARTEDGRQRFVQSVQHAGPGRRGHRLGSAMQPNRWHCLRPIRQAELYPSASGTAKAASGKDSFHCCGRCSLLCSKHRNGAGCTASGLRTDHDLRSIHQPHPGQPSRAFVRLSRR